jgi:hydrogenase maturation protease
MKRIICVGNRYVSEDAAGPKVYDRLARRALPHDVEVIDGGLAGLNLIRFIEGSERVVFVDTIAGFGRPGEVMVLDATEIAADLSVKYDHSGGLAYLLRVLSEVHEGAVPDVWLVGIEGGPTDKAIAAAADICLKVATEWSEQGASMNAGFSGERK